MSYSSKAIGIETILAAKSANLKWTFSVTCELIYTQYRIEVTTLHS